MSALLFVAPVLGPGAIVLLPGAVVPLVAFPGPGVVPEVCCGGT